MKLLRAKFTNYRLLRNLELDFALSEDKNLIVLRAENESGKTTILNALQWGLYGNEALPRHRGEYRLHPIDWDPSNGDRVEITVEIDFERTFLHAPRTGETQTSKERYRLIRSTTDTITDDSWTPGSTSVNLLVDTPQGFMPIEPPEALIRELLPIELREVFFTDGDRALSFVEADVSSSTKQAKVREAIRNLLGLDVIEEARLRVKKASSAVNAKVRAQISDAQLGEEAQQIELLQVRVDEYQDRIKDAEQQFNEFDQEWANAERRLEDLLSRGGGDREKIVTQAETARRSISNYDQQIKVAQVEHSRLFASLELARDLLAPALSSSFGILNELRQRGDIPNNTIPVLLDLLEADTCVCGEQLIGEETDAVHRRQHIEAIIERAREGDAAKTIATNLYFAAVEFRPGSSSVGSWASLNDDIARKREQLDMDRGQLGELQASLEAQIKQVPNVDIDNVRKHRNFCREQRDQFRDQQSRLQAQCDLATQDLANARDRRAQLLRRHSAGQRLVAELETAHDLETILNMAYTKLTNEELLKVSTSMNSMFLDMIVADSEQRGIIQRAEITHQFEIMVYGSENSQLNPDVDLNGASRRALTLAFILALTKVSEVEAPNVIDTPLGMMSGHVKESVLAKALQESSQLILFLTNSEIEGCQRILDSAASKVMTLTNSNHYPRMLVHPREDGEIGIIRCDCDHRNSCRVCQRRDTI